MTALTLFVCLNTNKRWVRGPQSNWDEYQLQRNHDVLFEVPCYWLWPPQLLLLSFDQWLSKGLYGWHRHVVELDDGIEPIFAPIWKVRVTFAVHIVLSVFDDQHLQLLSSISWGYRFTGNLNERKFYCWFVISCAVVTV